MKGSLEGKAKGTSVVRVVRVGTGGEPGRMLVRLRQAPYRLIVVRAGSFPREAKCVRPVGVTLSTQEQHFLAFSPVPGAERGTGLPTTGLDPPRRRRHAADTAQGSRSQRAPDSQVPKTPSGSADVSFASSRRPQTPHLLANTDTTHLIWTPHLNPNMDTSPNMDASPNMEVIVSHLDDGILGRHQLQESGAAREITTPDRVQVHRGCHLWFADSDPEVLIGAARDVVHVDAEVMHLWEHLHGNLGCTQRSLVAISASTQPRGLSSSVHTEVISGNQCKYPATWALLFRPVLLVRPVDERH